MEDIRLLFLLHMVEAMLVTFTALILFGIREKPCKILVVAAIQGLLVYLIRAFYIINNIPFGTHTFVTIFTLILLVHYLLKVEWNISIISLITAESLVLIGASFPLKLSQWFNIPFEKLFTNPLLFAAIGLTENLVIITISIFCLLTGFNLRSILSDINKKYITILIFIVLQAFISIYLVIYNLFYKSNDLFEVTKNTLIITNIVMALITIYLFISVFKVIKKSEKQEREILIQRNNRMLIEILKTIRHDFSNHITILNGLVQLEKNDEAKKYLKTLTSEMKSFSKLTSLKQQNLVAFLITKFQNANDYGIEINFSIKSNLENFEISTDKITKIFGNLIDNAFYKLNNSEQIEKRILIEIIEDELHYYFILTDNGPLVPEEIKDKIFKRGFTTKGSQGSGLGLYIVKTAVEQKGGKLFLDQDPIQGVKFICSFPIQQNKILVNL